LGLKGGEAEAIRPRSLSAKKLAGNPKAPAKFEQGGFTSRRRRVRRPFFRAQVPETYTRFPQPRNSWRSKIACKKDGRRDRFAPAGICPASSAKSAMLGQNRDFPASSRRSIGQLNRPSATLRNRKSR